MYFGLYKSLDYNSTKLLAKDLTLFSDVLLSKNRTKNQKRFETFLAIYQNPTINNLHDFKLSFFNLLKNLNSLDSKPWPGHIASDPEDPNFAFCFNGLIWFPVTLSPFHEVKIRKAPLFLIAFQSEITFNSNKIEYESNFRKMRAATYSMIDSNYINDNLPLYLTRSELGKNYSQYLADDTIITDPTSKCPVKFS